MISIFHTTDSSFSREFKKILERAKDDMQSLLPQVLATLEDIKKRGEDSLLELVSRFDGWNPKSLNDLLVDMDEAKKSYERLDLGLKKSLQTAFERIKSFHEASKPRGFEYHDECGNLLGLRILPLSRAGIYIPGGKAAYPSSLLMNALPAKVAGVQEIVVTTPAHGGRLNELVLAALHLCGIKECYKIGGVGAIGLLAYGASNLIKPVDCISGPGNIFVATAKKLVFGEVKIDMVAGPSEIGIIADSKARADYLALDLLSQAEHDERASALLMTDSLGLANEVAACIEENLSRLERRAIARSSIENRGAIIVTKNLNEAFSLMNEIAPEHLELVVQNPMDYLGLVKAAGAVFMGEYTPEAIGDYLAGPNHTLPTGGSARFFSPLSVDFFCRSSSLISFCKAGLDALGHDCARLAKAEGLEAHGLSVLARLGLESKG